MVVIIEMLMPFSYVAYYQVLVYFLVKNLFKNLSLFKLKCNHFEVSLIAPTFFRTPSCHCNFAPREFGDYWSSVFLELLCWSCNFPLFEDSLQFSKVHLFVPLSLPPSLTFEHKKNTRLKLLKFQTPPSSSLETNFQLFKVKFHHF